MENKFKRFLSLFVALVMVISMMPVSVFAADSYNVSEMSDEEILELCIRLGEQGDQAALDAIAAAIGEERMAKIEAMYAAMEGNEPAVIAETTATVTVYKQVDAVTDKVVDLKYFEYVDTATDLEDAVTKLNNAGANGGLIEISEGTLVVTNRQDITLDNVIIKGAGKDKTTITGNANNFNNSTNGLKASNSSLSSEHKAILGLHGENIKVVGLKVDAGSCGYASGSFLKTPADLKTVRVNSGNSYFEDVIITGKTVRSNLAVGTSNSSSNVTALRLKVDKPNYYLGYGAAMEKTSGSAVSSKDSYLGGAVIGSFENLGEGYYKLTYGGVTAYTTIPYAIETYNSGDFGSLMTAAFVAENAEQGVSVAQAMTNDLVSGKLLYGKNCAEMRTLAAQFRDALAGLSADTNVDAETCLNALDAALAIANWHSGNSGKCEKCGASIPVVNVPAVEEIQPEQATEEEKEVIQEVITEVAGNTAVQEEPVELPEGVKEIEIVLKEVKTATENNATVAAKLTFNVVPKNDTGEKVSNTAEEITFRLPIPAAWETQYVKVTHKDESTIHEVKGTGNAKYVEISSANFSEFAVEPTDETPAPTAVEVATLEALQAALADNSNDLPILVTNMIEIPAGATVELDLNGKTVNAAWNGTSTTNHIYAIKNYGTLTIMDSVGGGSINSRGIYNYSTLTLNGGTINAIDGNGGYAVNNQSGSTFIMNGGVVATTNEDDHQSSSGGYDATALKVPAGCTATLNGGKIVSVSDFTFAVEASGTLNIPATSTIVIEGAHGAIAVSGGTTTIDAGTFSIPKDEYVRTDNVLYVSGGKLVINGGTFTGDDDTGSGGTCVYDANGGATINGGTFGNSSGGDVWGTTGTTIKGGKFENLIEKQHIAEGFELDANGNVVKAAKDPSGKISYRGYINDSSNREAIQIDMENVYATTSLVIKLYDANGNLLTTTTLKAGAVDAENFTANIVLWGNASSSWNTEIHTKLTVNNIPETAKVYADGVLVDTYSNILGAGTNVNEVPEYLALDCVEKPATVVEVATLEELQAALAADNDLTIVITSTIVIPEGQTVTIDLNGKKVAMSSDILTTTYALDNKGTLTLKDSKGEGSISARGIYNYGTMTVESGIYNAMGNDGGAAIFNYSVVYIYGGTFTSVGGYSLNNQSGASMVIGSAARSASADITVTNGIYNTGATLTINNGNVNNSNSGRHTVYAWDSVVTINGGNIHNYNSGNSTVMAAGTSEVAITGGTFTINIVDASSSYLLDAQNTSSYTISGGDFTGGIRAQGGTSYAISGGTYKNEYGNYSVYTDGSVDITGGTFESEFAKEFAHSNVADGYELEQNADGTFGVQAVKTYVAEVNGVKYETIQAAINAAQNGATVTILPGEYSGFDISNKNITIQGTVGANGELLTTIKGGNPAITGHGFNGTIKDLKIVDAFKVMYAEPAGNVTVDNVYVTGATYGFHLVAYSQGLTWTIQNSYMDLSWANSFGVYGAGDAAIVIKGNEFASTNPYYPDYGALAVNTFLPNVTVEGNVFGENAKIMIRDSVTDTSKINISKNYHADGVENAFVEDTGAKVAITQYYTDVDDNGNLTGFVDARPVEVDGVKYDTLQEALNAAAAGTGNVTVEILTDIDLTGIDWTPVTISAPGYPVVTVNGNNKTITGLNDMLFAGTWAGNSGLIINDLTIKDSNIVNDENDAKGNVGVGAFVGFPQASATITLNNCHLVNSTVNGGHWTGGLIGYAAGYAGTDGPVFMNLTIKNCSVTGSTITGKGSVGGIIGHATGNGWTNVVIEATTVSGNTVTSTGSSTNKAGAVMGTIGAAGQATTVNGVEKTGGISVSATVSGNTVTSNGTAITTVYGRQGSTTGMLEIAGGSYDRKPIEDNVSYAAPAEGYKIIENTDGTYGIEVDPAYGKVAMIGENYYATLQAAIDAVQNGETIILLTDVTITTPAHGQNALNHARAVSFTLDLNGKTLSANTGNSVFRFNITNTGATSNVTVTIKNGKVIAGSNTWCALMAAGISADVKAVMNLEDLTVECSKAGDLGIKAWDYALINANNVTVNATNGAGGFYAVGGEIVLDNCTVNQKGLHTAPYLSMAIAVSSGGKATVNSGTYSAEPTAAAEGNNQGTSHGSWVAGVMNSGGTLIINGGTFSNGNFGEDSLATAARGLIFADTKGIVEVNGGTFHALKSVFDFQNNLGGTSPVITVKGGTYYADPAVVTSYGSVKIADGYCVTEANGVYTVAKAVAKIGNTYYATLEEAFKAATEGCIIEILADVTIDGKWDCRDYATGGSHSQFKESVTINGNGHTIKFTGTISDGNWNTIFRFEENAVVNNLIIDISEATGAQRVITAKKSLTVDGLTIIGSAKHGIIFGEGASVDNAANVEIVIKNSTLNGTYRAISDNESGKDMVKSIVVTNNTLNANVYLSATTSVVFNGNTAAKEVDIRSYAKNDAVLSVEAKGNTLNEDNTVKKYIFAKTIDAQTEFAVNGPKITVHAYVAQDTHVNGWTTIWGQVDIQGTESFYVEIYSGNTYLGKTTLVDANKVLLNGSKHSVSWHAFIDGSDSWWNTEWAIEPASNLVPTNVKYIVDGREIGNGEIRMSSADNLYPVVWAELRGVKYVCTELKGEGTVENPYLISRIEELVFFRDSVNAGETKYNAPGVYVALAADIDMAGIDWSVNIGDDCNATFDGIFDGKNHTIKNLTSTESAQKSDGYICTGLFGAIYGSAVIKNLTIENAAINVGDYTGSNIGILVGFAYAHTGSIENVKIIGNIKVDAPKAMAAGAIIGYAYSSTSTIKDCAVLANAGSYITASSEVGGIIGYGAGSKIENATVKNLTLTASGLVGGVAGLLFGTGVIDGATVNNVTLTITNDKWVNSAAIAVGTIAGNGTTVSGVTASGVNTDKIVGSIYTEKPSTVVPAVQAKIGDKYYGTLEAAIAAAQEGDTITLLTTYVVEAGEEVVLDLKGAIIVHSKECTASYEMILNKGVLTITDSVGGGKITFTDTSAGDPNFTWGSYTIRNEGTLVVENGTIEHKGAQAFATHMICAIFQYSGSTTINGGAISTPSYRSIRLWKGDMTINGGTFDGQVWVQAVDNSAKLTINGGTFEPNGQDASSVFVSNASYDVAFAVTDGIFNGKIGVSNAAKLAGAVTGGKFSENAKNGTNAALIAQGLVFGTAVNGYYAVEADPSVLYINNLEELKAFRDAVNAGNTFAGVTVYLAADIDLAGENWVAIGSAYKEHGFMGNFDGNGFKIMNLTINNPAVDTDGYVYAGFFGVTEGIDKDNQNYIKNLVIENVTIKTSGHIVAAAIAYPYYTALENITVCGDIAIEGGNYTAGALAYTRRCVDAKNVTVSGNADSYITGEQVVGGVISDIQMNGGLTANYSNFSVSGVAISGKTNVGGISGIIATQTLNGATVKNVALVCDDARVGIVAGSLGGTSTIKNVTVENVSGATAILGATYDGSAIQAKIGDTYYATLENALADNVQGEVVLLTTYVVEAGKTVVLDLKGKTVVMIDNDSTAVSRAMIRNNGNLTIEDSVGGGKLSYTYTGSDLGTGYSANTITSAPGSVLTVKSGTIENKTTSTIVAYAIDGLTNGGNGDVIVNINGGVITSERQAVRIFANSTINTGILNISGGEFTGRVIIQNASAKANKAALTITGGTFKANTYKTDVLYVGGSNSATIEINASVSGGTFIGEITETHVTGFVSGGTFNAPVAEELCAEGYIPTKNADGTYGVKIGKFVAQIGETKYESLYEAIEAAVDGDTIYLLPGTITERVVHECKKSITIIGAENFGTVMTGGLYLGYDNSQCLEYKITIRGIAFEGKGILVASRQNVVIDGNKFTNIHDYVATSQSASQNAISVIGSYINATITNNVIDGVTAGKASGIHLRDVKTAIVRGNTVTNTHGNSITINRSKDATGVTAVVENNILSKWGTSGEGRAIRSTADAGFTAQGNVMIHTNAPEQFVKVTDTTNINVSKNYWNGVDPTTGNYFTDDDGEFDAVAIIKSYYTDAAKTNLVELENEVPEVTFTLNGLNLRLQDLIKLGFYFAVDSDAELATIGALLWTEEQYLQETDFTVNSQTAQNAIAEWAGTRYMVETNGIYVQNLDTVYYIIPYAVTEDGVYVYGEAKSSSALVYANIVYNGQGSANTKSIVIDLLNYATAARTYFGYAENMPAPEKPFNSILSAADQVVAWNDSLRASYPVVDELTGTYNPTINGLNTNLQEAIRLNFIFKGSISGGIGYWTEEEYRALSEHNRGNMAHEATISQSSAGNTVGSVVGLYSYDIYSNFYVMAYDAEGNCSRAYGASVASYLTTVIDQYSGSSDPEKLAMMELAKAMLVYGANAMNNPDVNKGAN